MEALLTKKLEGLLFYFGESVSVSKLSSLCGESKDDVQDALTQLQNDLTDRGITLVIHNNSAQLVTDEGVKEIISEAVASDIDTDLTDPQSEALSVIAYLAPVTKPTIDFVRGVNSRAVLRNLSTRGLISRKSQDSTTYYNLSMDAMTHLGITELSELPDYDSTRERLEEFVMSDSMHNED